VNVTPFEPEWEGFGTLEISNTTPLPAKVYSNEGLCQILFFQSDEPCEISYKDKSGKYQKQTGIVLLNKDTLAKEVSPVRKDWVNVEEIISVALSLTLISQTQFVWIRLSIHVNSRLAFLRVAPCY